MRFEYMYIELKSNDIYYESIHKDTINKYAKEGWRYIDSIATSFYTNNGQPKTYDLVFEKVIEE